MGKRVGGEEGGEGVALTRLTNVSLRAAELLAKQRFELWSHFLKVHERERKSEGGRGNGG